MRARFRVGLIPRGPGDPAVAAFVAAIGDLLGERTELAEAPDYRVLVASMEQRNIDFAWLPPLVMGRSLRKKIASPLAVAVRHGRTSYMSALIALTQSPLVSLEDVKGVRAAWVDRESAGGYVVIRAALKEAGISLVDAFREELFVRGHAEVARALSENRADVGATYVHFSPGTTTVQRGGYEDGGLARDAVRVLAYAGPIPSDAIAAASHVPPAVAARLQGGLIATNEQVATLAKRIVSSEGFVRPSDQYVALLDEIYETVRSPLSARRPGL